MFGSAGVARLVEAQVGGDDRRHLELHGLQAAVDLAGDQDAVALDHELRGEGALRPAEQRRQHLAGLVAVVVDRLLAEDDEAGLLLLDDGLEDLGDGERLDRARRSSPGCRGRRPWRARCGWSRRPAPGRSRPRRSRSPCPLSFSRIASSTAISSKGFIDILTLASSTPRAVALDANFDVVVDDPLDGHQNFHGVRSRGDRRTPPRRLAAARRRRA